MDDMKAMNDELQKKGEVDNKWVIRGDKLVNIKVRPNPGRQNF